MMQKNEDDFCCKIEEIPALEVDFLEDNEKEEVDVKCAFFDKNSKYLISDMSELFDIFDEK